MNAPLRGSRVMASEALLEVTLDVAVVEVVVAEGAVLTPLSFASASFMFVISRNAEASKLASSRSRSAADDDDDSLLPLLDDDHPDEVATPQEVSS